MGLDKDTSTGTGTGTAANAPVTLLLVEDQGIIALAQAGKLRQAGYEVIHVFSGEEAVHRATRDASITLVLMDIDLGAGLDGPEAARLILVQREIPIVFLTGHAEQEMVDRVRRITRYGYVLKNSGDFVVRSAIEMALELFTAQQRTRRELARNEAILQASPDLTFVMTPDGKYVDARAADTSRLVVSPENGAGAHLRDVFPPEEVERQVAMFRRCHETGEPQRFDYNLRIQGRECIFDARLVRMDEEHLLAITRDVTDERERERADRAAREQRLMRKLDFQKLVARVSSDFMRVPDGETDAAVRRTLTQLGEFFGGDRCYLMEFSRDRSTLRETYEWTAPGVAPVIMHLQEVDVSHYRWVLERILEGRTVQVPDVTQLPDEAASVREVFVARGVVSFLALPLVTAERTEGYLGLHAVQTRKSWSGEQIEQMRVVGEIVAGALARRRAVQDLAMERQLMNVLMDHSPDSIYFKDGESRFIRVSRSVARLGGLDDPDLAIGKSDADWFPPEEARLKLEQERQILRTGTPLLGLEEKETSRDGTVRWRSTTKVPITAETGEILGIFGISRDITDRREDRQRLEAYARDQELLLREVHHRIKNSMNMIRSLIDLHDDRITDESARATVRELRTRIVGMISVYDQIDTAADFREVSVPEYLESLLRNIAEAFDISQGTEITGTFAPCTVDSRVLFPLGLIVNELVTNGIKYGRTLGGRVQVSLAEDPAGGWILEVADNGPGLPAGFSPESSRGLGLGLVSALVEQIRGSFTIGADAAGAGTVATVRFP